MPGLLLTCWLFLGQITLLSHSLPAQPHAPAPVAQPATTLEHARQERSAVEQNVAAAFEHSTIGKLFTGEKHLSPEELGHLEFWIALVKEPLLAAIGFIPRVFVAVVFLVLFWLIYRGLRRLVAGSLGKAVDPSIRDMLGHLIKWTVMGFGLVIACNQIGIQITALLTGVSIVGLAMGLAAQETLANFIAGIVIFWDKPFRIGDSIEIEGVSGVVQRVTFRSTRMLGADGQVIVLPNTYVLAHRLCNHSTHTITRVNVPVGIAYRESIDTARAVMLALVENDPRVCQDPQPVVVVSDCADSSVKLILRFWIHERENGSIMYFEYMEKVKKALDRAGIEIPFPHLQLLMEQPAARELRAAG